MKITQESSEFKPVTIVLETEEELKVFHGVIQGAFFDRDLLNLVSKNLYLNNADVFRFMNVFKPLLDIIVDRIR